MILSVSRRTDIPAFYGEWFMNRIDEGFVCVRNPFNTNQISRIDISPNVVDCIVFWTKNPKPLLPYLAQLDNLGYKYYFQFTITPYDTDIEENIFDKKEIINTFVKLSKAIGKQKVILRYDPVILTKKYDMDFHVRVFKKLCEKLGAYTDKVIISFLDDYKKTAKNMKDLHVKEITKEDMTEIATKFVKVTNDYGLILETCAEAIDLEYLNIDHAKCIDGNLIEEIVEYEIINKDKLDANRKDCGCMKSIDIGQYDSCIHNCLYCYANVNKERALSNYKRHNPKSSILFGEVDLSSVKDRKNIKSLKRSDASSFQLSLFDQRAELWFKWNFMTV